MFFGSIRKYDLLLPIYQENDSFLEETWDRTSLFQVDIELVEKKNKESASVRKMIRYTKDTFMYSPWVFAMSPRSIEQLKETSESSNKVSSLLLHYEHILESADQ